MNKAPALSWSDPSSDISPKIDHLFCLCEWINLNKLAIIVDKNTIQFLNDINKLRGFIPVKRICKHPCLVFMDTGKRMDMYQSYFFRGIFCHFFDVNAALWACHYDRTFFLPVDGDPQIHLF